MVVPERGVQTPSTVLIQRLVEEADPSRVIVSLDWISDCLALDQLLDVGAYLLQSSSRINQDDKKFASRRESQYHRSDMLSIQLEELSMSVAPSLLAKLRRHRLPICRITQHLTPGLIRPRTCCRRSCLAPQTTISAHRQLLNSASAPEASGMAINMRACLPLGPPVPISLSMQDLGLGSIVCIQTDTWIG